MGNVVIGTPEFEESGIPEIEYDSEQKSVGEGTITDWMKAIWLIKHSVKIFKEKTGWRGDIIYEADNRDGGRNSKEKNFWKISYWNKMHRSIWG